MVKCRSYIILFVVFLFGTFLGSGCDNQITREAGFLEGIISIGPLCPVEKDPPDPDCLPTLETYKAYPVSIWTSNGERKITQVNPALDGSYKVALNPGNYLVILENGQNRIGSSNLPEEVEINSQTETILNIDIDTGIR
jgi:hypothetical protein